MKKIAAIFIVLLAVPVLIGICVSYSPDPYLKTLGYYAGVANSCGLDPEPILKEARSRFKKQQDVRAFYQEMRKTYREYHLEIQRIQKRFAPTQVNPIDDPDVFSSDIAQACRVVAQTYDLTRR